MLLQMGSLVFIEVPVLLLPVIVKILECTSQGCRQVVKLIRSQLMNIQSRKKFMPPFLFATGLRLYPIFSSAEDGEQDIIDLLLVDMEDVMERSHFLISYTQFQQNWCMGDHLRVLVDIISSWVFSSISRGQISPYGVIQ